MKTMGAKRGRKRIVNVSRTESGRISRAREPADRVALEARAKHLGISVEQARDQRAETFIGALAIRGRESGLSKEQYEALTHYTELRADFHRAVKAPNAMASNGVQGGSGDVVSDGYVAWTKSAIGRYCDARTAIEEAQWANRVANILAAVDYLVHRDQRLEHMVGDLRLGANALCLYFAQERRREGIDRRPVSR